jgi:hypothetical protein
MEEQELTQDEKLRHLQAFVMSPVWTSILKPMLTMEFNIKVRKLVASNNPREDYDTKAEIRAWARLLDFEKTALQKIKIVENELIEQKQRALEDNPQGTPYAR